MKQVHDSYETVLQSKDEIRKRFAAYDFRDTVGHPLLLCADFDSLVNSYCLLATHRNDFEIVMEIFKALARLSSESLNIPAILSHTLYAEAERRERTCICCPQLAAGAIHRQTMKSLP